MIYLIITKNSTNEVLIILGTISVIFVRLLPLINRFVYDIQLLNWSKSVLNSYPLEDKSDNSILINQNNLKQNIIFEKKIKFSDVRFFYKDRDLVILDKINFDINKGEYVGIKGSTGTGKSTILDLIMGLISPSSGEIKVDEKKLEINNRNWHEKIGYVPQDVTLINENILKNIAFGVEEKEIDMQKINKCVEIANLSEFINQLPNKFETNIGHMSSNISGGQKQRIGIARALYHDPEILIFDEATNSLDEKTEQQILNVIKKLKGEKTIIFVSHQTNPLKYCDKIIDLK